MQSKILVVIGGNGAGLAAASQVRRLDSEISVLVLEKSPFVSFSACGFPFYLRKKIVGFESLFVFSPQQLELKRNIRILTRVSATEIRPEQGVVLARDQQGRDLSFNYDKLLIATGSRALLPAGMSPQNGWFALRSAQDAQELDTFLKTRMPREVLVIGGSVLGLEMAESFQQMGLNVTIIEGFSRLLPQFDSEIGELAEQELRNRGIKVIKGNPARQYGSEGPRHKVELSDSQVVYGDFILFAMGVKPEIELARNAGLAIGKSGAIQTTRQMQTSDPHIFAAGDCAQYLNLINQKGVFFPQGAAANRSGRTAGSVIAGSADEYPGVLQNLAVKIYDLEIARAGLTRDQAEEDYPGFKTHKTRYHNKSKYLADSRELFIALFYDGESHKLLGAEIAGPQGVAQRVNVLAAALTAGFTLNQISKLDLSYYPEFSPVWDPIIYAAGEAVIKSDV